MTFTRLRPGASARRGTGVTVAWRLTSGRQANICVVAFSGARLAAWGWARGTRVGVEYCDETARLRVWRADQGDAEGYALTFKRHRGRDISGHISMVLPGIHGERRAAQQVEFVQESASAIAFVLQLPDWAKRPRARQAASLRAA